MVDNLNESGLENFIKRPQQSDAQLTSIQNETILLVGPPLFVALLKDLLHNVAGLQKVTSVEGYLWALGEAFVRPPTVVIGSLDGLDEMARSVASGLRQLGGDIVLLLIAKPHEESIAKQAVEDGFDHSLFQPKRAQVLLDAILAVRQQRGALTYPSPKQNNMQQHTTQPDIVQQGDTQQRNAELGSIPQSSAELNSTQLFGASCEVDLIRCLIQEHGEIADLGIQWIRQQSGNTPIAFSQNQADAPINHARAEVTFDGKVFGYLHAPAPMQIGCLTPWARWLGNWIAIEYKMKNLVAQTLTDHLTGIGNRRQLDQTLNQLVQRHDFEPLHLTLLRLEIDDFNNDAACGGQSLADQLLRETAKMLQAVIRPHDGLVRVGEKGFAIVFWDMKKRGMTQEHHLEQIDAAIKDFQKSFEQQTITLVDKSTRKVTFSAGLASLDTNVASATQLFEAARLMQLKSKEQGENKMMILPSALP